MPPSFIYSQKAPSRNNFALHRDSLKLPFASGKWAVRGWRTSATKPPVLRFFHPSQTSAAGCTVPAALAKSFILGQVPRNPVKTWTARIQEAAAPSTLGRDAPNAVDIVRYNTNLLISELWVHPVKR